MRNKALIIFFILGCTLLPGYLTPVIEISPASVLQSELPAKAKGGAFFLIKLKDSADFKISIGRQTLSKVEGTPYYLGGIGIDLPHYVQVWGWKKSPSGFWGHTTIQWFGTFIEVEKAPLESGSSLRIPAAVWEKVSADEELRKVQREKLGHALERNDGTVTPTCFGKPISSKIVSQFASPRKLPNGHAYYHTGTDLRAATGTRVLASGDGEVVIAEGFIVPGNTVMLYHGGGLYSAYKHLSEIDVKPGMKIKKGDLLGLSGATGRVEAPHLHWEFFWKGHPVDPLALLETWAPLCDLM